MRSGFVFLALLCSFSATNAQPGVVLDQSVLFAPQRPSANLPVAAGVSVAQTFEVGLAGTLWSFQTPIGYSGTPSAPLKLELRGVTPQGEPSNTVLDSWVVPAEAFPNGAGFATFSPDVPVSVGDRFSLVFSSESQAADGLLAYNTYVVSAGYDRGQLFTTAPGGGWQKPLNQEYDLVFSTYILVPEPSVILLGLVGFGIVWGSTLIRRVLRRKPCYGRTEFWL